jgi:hypothetical protein
LTLQSHEKRSPRRIATFWVRRFRRMTSARIVSCSSFGSWAIRTLRRMSARVIPACIMIAPASLRVSGLPRPSSRSRRARFRSTRSFAALVWTAAFAALASLLAIARSAASMSLRHLQSYRCARDAAPPRSADPPWRSTSRSSSGVESPFACDRLPQQPDGLRGLPGGVRSPAKPVSKGLIPWEQGKEQGIFRFLA